MLMASFGEGEGEEHEVESKKTDSNGENEKRDFRGNYFASFLLQFWNIRQHNRPLNADALTHSAVLIIVGSFLALQNRLKNHQIILCSD